MPRILAIHYMDEGKLPELSEEEFKEIEEKAVKRIEEEEEVKFKGTFDDEEGRGICD